MACPLGMRRYIGILLFVAAIAAIDHGIEAGISQQLENPVSVVLTSPINGTVVSNTITVTALASSTMGPIVKVIFYRDGIPFATNEVKRPFNLRAYRID